MKSLKRQLYLICARIPANTKRQIRCIAVTALILVIALSALDVCSVQRGYAAEFMLHQEILAYKPSIPFPEDEDTDARRPAPPPALQEASEAATAENDVAFDNPTIISLRERNADTVGWLTLPHTGIDYPFVRSQDNDFYLRRDIDGKPNTAGTVFMDARCAADFSSFNTILYGHNMKSGTMFHDLRKFADREFWASNESGYIFLPHETLRVQVFAYLLISGNDPVIYEGINADAAERAQFLSYAKSNAYRWRDPDLSADGNILTLSTCSYEYKNARTVLLAKIVDAD